MINANFRNGTKEPPTDRKGFTVIELVFVVAASALLILTMLPALASSRTKSESVRCISNLRQIMGAMLMYTHDYHDFFPPNPDDGNTIPGHHWCGGNAAVGGAQEFDPDILADPANCLITTYLNTNVSLFRCTADPRTGLYQGTNAAMLGTIVPAARTISMNGGVGTICQQFNNGFGHGGSVTFEVNGPWLDGSHGNRHNSPWRTYDKITDMVIPIPARLLVVAEEAPWSINDAALSLSAGQPKWVDFPSDLHAGAGVLTFADGHVELHKWVTGTLHLGSGSSLAPSNADWIWVAQHSTENVVTGQP